MYLMKTLNNPLKPLTGVSHNRSTVKSKNNGQNETFVRFFYTIIWLVSTFENNHLFPISLGVFVETLKRREYSTDKVHNQHIFTKPDSTRSTWSFD